MLRNREMAQGALRDRAECRRRQAIPAAEADEAEALLAWARQSLKRPLAHAAPSWS